MEKKEKVSSDPLQPHCPGHVCLPTATLHTPKNMEEEKYVDKSPEQLCRVPSFTADDSITQMRRER